MMDSLVHACRQRGISVIRGYYYPTAKNAMVKNFYELQNFKKLEEDEAGNSTWQFVIPDVYERKNTVIAVNGEPV
jgi:predicted enzyme involved in methoxymalonyl-ACP biosynthesis